MNEKDLNFFRPVWRRGVLVLLLLAWTTVEWLTANPFWGTLTTGALGFAVWMFTVGYRQTDVATKPKVPTVPNSTRSPD